MITSREIHLVNRPDGEPDASCFNLVETRIPEPSADQVLIKNQWMSVDPYMRGRMDDVKRDVPPFQFNEAMTGGALGQVIESNHSEFEVGDWVESFMGWREYFLSDGIDLTKRNVSDMPPQCLLGVLGMPGLTAYVGTVVLGKVKKGETVYVSAAAGAVGSVVGQLAKARGCTVVGSAGSQEKIFWLENTAKFDAVFNYKIESAEKALSRLCPDGIDFYFDNVGGSQLEGALDNMKNHGRILCCGAIENANKSGEKIVGIRNLYNLIKKRLIIRGFDVWDHDESEEVFIREMTNLIGSDKMMWRETVREGIESSPEALLGLFRGENTGKMLVKLNN